MMMQQRKQVHWPDDAYLTIALSQTPNTIKLILPITTLSDDERLSLSTINASIQDKLRELHPLSNDSIHAFLTHIEILYKQDYFSSNVKEHIKTIIRRFFNNIVNNLPNHVVLPGCPGYKEHLKELEQIDERLKQLNRVLGKFGIINTHSMLRIQNPDNIQRSNAWGFDGFPLNLPAFLQSIDIRISGCLRTWAARFKYHSPEVLGQYLAQVTLSIQQISDEQTLNPILKKLEQFITQLKRHNHHIQADMFAEVAENGDRSPLRLDQHHNQYEILLKEQLNVLSIQNARVC